MNVSRFHVSCIQEMDYRPHFICGGLLDFLENFKHTGRCVNMVRLSENCVRTIVTAALQRQYLQTELILWIRLLPVL
jgi:hypothetical protein